MPSKPSAKKDQTDTNDDNMAASIQKKRRSPKPKVALSAKSTSTTSSSSSTHPYLENREIDAIEHWNESIPPKATRAANVSNDADPVVQAYMQAKMALFHDLSVKQRKSNSSISTSQG